MFAQWELQDVKTARDEIVDQKEAAKSHNPPLFRTLLPVLARNERQKKERCQTDTNLSEHWLPPGAFAEPDLLRRADVVVLGFVVDGHYQILVSIDGLRGGKIASR